MKTKFPPEPETVTSDLAPLAALLYPVMDAGADHAVQYFEQRKLTKIDPWLHSHLVRHYVKLRLKADGIAELSYRFIMLPFSGLLLENDRYFVRILKVRRRPDRSTGSFIREIQGPGTSQARLDYFYQPALEIDDETPPLARLVIPTKLKLVILWDVDAAYQLTVLELACPKAFSPSTNAVHTHWWVPIPDPRSATQTTHGPEFDKPVMLEDLEFPTEDRDTAVGDDDADSR